jgi:hypothetical protein
MTRATDAYAVLATEMDYTDPACSNDERFIADDQNADELAPICNACPLFALCDAYARIDRPKAGIWAGKRYRTNKPKGE